MALAGKIEIPNALPSIDRIDDGQTYFFPEVNLIETGLFLKVGCLGGLFIKVPSTRGWNDYRTYVKSAKPHADDVRTVENLERWEQLNETLALYPPLQAVLKAGSEDAHYLAVHKLQYERLRTQRAVRIPRAKFGLLRSNRHRFLSRLDPALFQEKAHGVTLWDMFDFSLGKVGARWRELLPAISTSLRGLIDSPLAIHIDWNIKNFLYDSVEDCLSYVDMKPTTFVSRSTNAINLKGLRDHFVV